MAAPLLQTQIDIEAPVHEVWELISDLRRMPEWSPQCRVMKLRGPLRPGARTFNLNKRKFTYWPTTSTILEVVPQQKLAFKTDINHTVWSYELQPTESGTRLTESRHAENGVTDLSNALINTFMGGVPSFEAELVDGMNTSLARI